MRKLRPAEKKVLLAFPNDVALDSEMRVVRGTIHSGRYPIGTNIATIQNLWDMGYIEHSYINFYSCPMRLTEKGKQVLAELQGNQDEQ
jgi:hypothetical protein